MTDKTERDTYVIPNAVGAFEIKIPKAAVLKDIEKAFEDALSLIKSKVKK